MRMQDCKEELHGLLQEDVRIWEIDQVADFKILTDTQRLAGASLLVFANKQDIQGSMIDSEIRDVRTFCFNVMHNA
jgi:ADP-ribosylation factor-like protein 2